jgi:hypothetical protein
MCVCGGERRTEACKGENGGQTSEKRRREAVMNIRNNFNMYNHTTITSGSPTPCIHILRVLSRPTVDELVFLMHRLVQVPLSKPR